MKTNYYILFFGLLLVLGACEIDNYDEPDAFFTGQITYEGDPIGVAHNQVRFQLWQSGFGNEGPLDVHVAQDGSFSSRLFSGNYRLDFLEGQGPFKAKVGSAQQGDTIYLDLNGSTEMDLEVTPYYMIRNPDFSVSGGIVGASANIEQIITGEDARSIDHVSLYVNRTIHVSDNGDEHLWSSGADLANLNSVTMNVELPDNLNQNYVFARIGVKIAGVEDMLFSQVERLDF